MAVKVHIDKAGRCRNKLYKKELTYEHCAFHLEVATTGHLTEGYSSYVYKTQCRLVQLSFGHYLVVILDVSDNCRR